MRGGNVCGIWLRSRREIAHSRPAPEPPARTCHVKGDALRVVTPLHCRGLDGQGLLCTGQQRVALDCA